MLYAGQLGDKISGNVLDGDSLLLAADTAGVSLSSPAGAVPRDRWFCLELAIGIDAAGGSGYAELSLDGASVLRTTSRIATNPAAGYPAILVGATSGDKKTTLELFVDDVVIATSPIGCR